MLIRWAQREGTGEGYTGLRPEPESTIHTLSTRLEAAASTWGDMWVGGATYEKRASTPLEPINGTMIRHVLDRRGSGKARGADGWGPAELAMLPDAWLDALGRMMGKWEDEGRGLRRYAKLSSS